MARPSACWCCTTGSPYRWTPDELELLHDVREPDRDRRCERPPVQLGPRGRGPAARHPGALLAPQPDPGDRGHRRGDRGRGRQADRPRHDPRLPRGPRRPDLRAHRVPGRVQGHRHAVRSIACGCGSARASPGGSRSTTPRSGWATWPRTGAASRWAGAAGRSPCSSCRCPTRRGSWGSSSCPRWATTSTPRTTSGSWRSSRATPRRRSSTPRPSARSAGSSRSSAIASRASAASWRSTSGSWRRSTRAACSR